MNQPLRPSLSVAIVGGGAACAMVLAHLASASRRLTGHSITIFEPREAIGPGLAYQEQPEVLQVNTPVDVMGVHTDDVEEFFRLLQREGRRTFEVPRSVFGRYLEAKTIEACEILTRNGVFVRHVRERVTKLDLGACLLISTGRMRYSFDSCILASGGVFKEPAKQLRGRTNYIRSPLDIEAIKRIPAGAQIGVLGTGQSALDIAVLRGKATPGEHLTLFSRKGILPRVRYDGPREHPTPLLAGLSDLDSFLSRVSSEISWSSPRLRDGIITSSLRSFVVDAKRAARQKPSWQSVMERITPELNSAWASIEYYQRRRFLGEYAPLMYYLRSAVPLATAKRVLPLYSKRYLDVLKGPYRLYDRRSTFKYRNREEERDFDIIINAAGLTPVGALDYLLQDSQPDIRSTSDGGLEVDLNCMRLLRKNGSAYENVYALGFPTKGAALVVNSIELLRPQAKMIADQIVNIFSKGESALCVS